MVSAVGKEEGENAVVMFSIFGRDNDHKSSIENHCAGVWRL